MFAEPRNALLMFLQTFTQKIGTKVSQFFRFFYFSTFDFFKPKLLYKDFLKKRFFKRESCLVPRFSQIDKFIFLRFSKFLDFLDFHSS